jgi:serine/threonine protein kinase
VSIPEGGEPELGLDKSFGFSKHFFAKYDLGEEVGRGHFGYTCSAKAKKGEHKGQDVAVKVIPKAKVRRARALMFHAIVHCHAPFSSCLYHLVIEERLCTLHSLLLSPSSCILHI